MCQELVLIAFSMSSSLKTKPWLIASGNYNGLQRIYLDT